MRRISQRIGGHLLMLSLAAGVTQGVAAQSTNASPRRGELGAIQGDITGSFQGDPAQPNVDRTPRAPALPSPNPPRPGRPSVIIVNPPGYQTRPLRSVAGDDYRQAIERALGAPTGQMISWINAAGAGQVTAIGDRFVDGMNCRDLRQSVTTVASSQETTSTYCISPTGEWLLLVGPS